MDTSAVPSSQRDSNLILEALKEARKAIPVESAYCVGAVIVNNQNGKIVASGYSRELPGNTHAEECALAKLNKDGNDNVEAGVLEMVTTMEPCSTRLSGNIPCTQRILEFGKIKRVIVGVREPADFVVCEGTKLLRDQGVEVVYVSDHEKECVEVARRKV